MEAGRVIVRSAEEMLVLPIDRGIYSVRSLERYPELLQGITTRLSPNGEDWNLSARRGTPQHPPSWERAVANRETLAERLGISPGRMVGCQQIHGSEVALVTGEDAGKGMRPDRPSIQGADAMVTDEPGLYLLALSADCPPVFFYDPRKRAIGLAHSGWKGTVGQIAARVVEDMGRHFGSSPSDIVAAIGPSIGVCCYEVGPNVVEAAEPAFPAAWQEGILEKRDGAIYFDLQAGIRRSLLDAGLQPGNISVEPVCTAHNLHTFYSHRGEKGQCGLFGAVLGMRNAGSEA